MGEGGFDAAFILKRVAVEMCLPPAERGDGASLRRGFFENEDPCCPRDAALPAALWVLRVVLWSKRFGGLCLRVFFLVLTGREALARDHNPFHFRAVFEKLTGQGLTGIKTS